MKRCGLLVLIMAGAIANDRRFYLHFDSVDKHADSLSVDEMKRIISSLRYFRIP